MKYIEEETTAGCPKLKPGQTRVATLHLIVDENEAKPNDIGSHLMIHPNESFREYALILQPSKDAETARECSVKGLIAPTTLAHELGHFICQIVKKPSHSKLAAMLKGKSPEERDAWALAAQMNPALNAEFAAAAMHTYETKELMESQDPGIREKRHLANEMTEETMARTGVSFETLCERFEKDAASICTCGRCGK